MATTKFDKRETAVHKVLKEDAFGRKDVRILAQGLLLRSDIGQEDRIAVLGHFIYREYKRHYEPGTNFLIQIVYAALDVVDFELIAKEILEDCEE